MHRKAGWRFRVVILGTALKGSATESRATIWGLIDIIKVGATMGSATADPTGATCGGSAVAAPPAVRAAIDLRLAARGTRVNYRVRRSLRIVTEAKTALPWARCGGATIHRWTPFPY